MGKGMVPHEGVSAETPHNASLLGRKGQGLGGQGDLLETVVEYLCGQSGLRGQAGDLGDGVLVGRGAGH
jgi:hypothetical protein